MIHALRNTRFLLPLLGVAACTAGEDASRYPAFEVTDSGGVMLVHNRMNVGEEDPRLMAVEDLRLGQIDGENEAEMFFGIRDLLVDEDGTIYVGNDQTGTVRVFSSDGEFLREFGGKGGGPFEVGRMLNDLFFAGDSIVVVDWQGAGKTIVFTKDGEFVTSWQQRRPGGPGVVSFAFSPRGWITAYDPSPTYRAPPGEALERQRDLWLYYPDADSLGPVLFDLPPIVYYGTRDGGTHWPLFRSDRSLSLDGQGHLFFRQGAEYRIDVLGPDGNLTRSIRREVPLDTISEAQVDAYVEKINEFFDSMAHARGGGYAASVQEQRRNALDGVEDQVAFPRPATAPTLGRILATSAGSVWAERLDHRPLVDWWWARNWGGFDRIPETASLWDLFSPEGRFLGSVEFPPRFLLVAVTEGAAVGVWKDEFDVEYVLRFSIQAGN